MLFFRYYLYAAIAVILFWWPINYLLGYYLYKRRVNKITQNMPAVDDYPILGCALRFLGKDNREMMEIIRDIFSRQQTPFLGWMGSKCFMVVDHPDDLQIVLTSKTTMEKGELYRFFNRGVGLFSAPVHVWKPQRKLLAMSFSNQISYTFLPIFNEKAKLFIRNINRQIGKGDFDLLKLATACTLDIVCESVLGSPMNIQNGENTRFMKALTDWLTAVTRRSINIFLHPEIIYKQSQTYQMESKALAISDSMQEELIVKKIEEIEISNRNNNESYAGEDEDEDEENEKILYERPQIFIRRLIRLRNKGLISDQAIRDQVALVMFGGQDTSSYTISFAILLLAMHPKIEQRVMDELNTVFGDAPLDVDVTLEHLNQLIYLEQVIKETLRVFPVGPILLRHCTEDTQLRNCVIPKGTDIIMSVFTAHRRKDIWGLDADEFNPDHFDKEVSAKRNPFAFMAFSNGPRNCLGRRFATISIKTILSKVLRRYRFTTHLGMEDMKFSLEVTAKPVNGVHVEVEERNL